MLSIGRPADAKHCVMEMEMCGKHLFYVLKLDGGWIWLCASLMDTGTEPESLLSAPDGAKGFRTICRLIAALERNQVRSLARPIEAGTGER